MLHTIIANLEDLRADTARTLAEAERVAEGLSTAALEAEEDPAVSDADLDRAIQRSEEARLQADDLEEARVRLGDAITALEDVLRLLNRG